MRSTGRRINKDVLKRLEIASKLKLNDDEIDDLLVSLNNILEWFERIEEVDTSGIEPLYHPLEDKGVLREDIERPSLTRSKLSQLNKPIKEGYIVSPWKG